MRIYASNKISGTCTFDGTTLAASYNQVQLKGVMRKGKTFYMAVAPGTYTKLDIYVNNQPVSEMTRENKTLEAGKIYDMGKLTNNRRSITLDSYSINNIPSSITESDVDYSYTDWLDYSAKYPFFDSGYSFGYGNKVYLVAEDGITLTCPSDQERKGNGQPTKNGQIYSVFYQKYGMNLYFNIDWEGKYDGNSMKRPIVDIQDRHYSYEYQLNRSYYDESTKTLHFDFANHQESTIKLFHGEMIAK